MPCCSSASGSGRGARGALAIGFAGALLIIRPSFDQAGLALLAVVGAAAGWAAMGLCNKLLTRTDGTEQIVALNVLMVLPFSLALALLDWQWPSLEMWALGAALGTLGTLAHICMAHAFSHADASFCMPFDFTRLPIAAAIAYPLFGQLPDLWTLRGRRRDLLGDALRHAARAHRSAGLSGASGGPPFNRAPRTLHLAGQADAQSAPAAGACPRATSACSHSRTTFRAGAGRSSRSG